MVYFTLIYYKNRQQYILKTKKIKPNNPTETKIRPIENNPTEFRINNNGFGVFHPDLKEGENVSTQTLRDMMNATGKLLFALMNRKCGVKDCKFKPYRTDSDLCRKHYKERKKK